MSAFRDPALTDEPAIDAMRVAADAVLDCALAQRRALLDLGFSETHTFCRNLDRIAVDMASAHTTLQNMANQLAKLTVPSDEGGTDG